MRNRQSVYSPGVSRIEKPEGTTPPAPVVAVGVRAASHCLSSPAPPDSVNRCGRCCAFFGRAPNRARVRRRTFPKSVRAASPTPAFLARARRPFSAPITARRTHGGAPLGAMTRHTSEAESRASEARVRRNALASYRPHAPAEAARIIAKIPAFIADERLGHADTTASRSGSAVSRSVGSAAPALPALPWESVSCC